MVLGEDAAAEIWGSSPVILIFSDTPEGWRRATDGADRAGGRVAACLPLDQAIERLENQVSVDLVIVDVMDDHGALLDRIFRRLDAAADARRFASIVVLAPPLLDIATAAISHQAVSLMVGHDEAALSLAVARAIRQPAMQLREHDEKDEAVRLAMLSEEMDRIARTLSASLADQDAPADAAAISFDALRPADAAVLRDLIRGRRLREHFFGRGMFADPAWDILLDLTAARIERRPVAVSSLCIAAAVPATTALRWIKQLTDAGLLRRVADPGDGRRVFIELTDNAASRMLAYFSAMARGARV